MVLGLSACAVLAGCPSNKAATDTGAGAPGTTSTAAVPPVTTAPPIVPSVKATLQQDFYFTSFDGQIVSLSDYAGQPLVLNFWADW